MPAAAPSTPLAAPVTIGLDAEVSCSTSEPDVMMHYIRLGVALLMAGAMAACSKPTTDDSATRGAVLPPVQEQPLPAPDTMADPLLHRLEREAVALAKAEGCASAGQCRSAPVGNRPCGGPRYYVAYCPLTTDSAALFAKLGELSRAEGEYNQKNGLASTCEMRLPSELALVGGSCRFR